MRAASKANAASGVRECWLVQPYPAVIEVLELTGEDYRVAGVYTEAETLHSPTFPELVLDLSSIFSLPIPAAEQIAEIRESAPPYSEAPAPTLPGS